MISEKQYEDVIDTAIINMQLQQSWRWGQSVFNTLYAMHPAFANTIRDTERDMYHRDENVELLKTYIKTNQDD